MKVGCIWILLRIYAIGYAFSERIDTNLTISALNMAISKRKPGNGLIFHSDRGVQYASTNYRERLSDYHICQSMSRKGDPYDNAVAENFFSCFFVRFYGNCTISCLTSFFSFIFSIIIHLPKLL